MKGSTIFLTILGISILLLGAGLVFTLPSQTIFPNNYLAQISPVTLGGFEFQVGDFFVIYMLPDSQVLQFIPYPLTSLNYFGGFIASNNPVNIAVYGISNLGGTPLIEINNALLAAYFSDLPIPQAFGGVILEITNTGSEPAILIGQSMQYTTSLSSNPMINLGYALIAVGVFIGLVGMIGERWQPKPLTYIPSSAGETISTGLRIWKRIFASIVIPFGLIYSIYLLIYFLGYSYSSSSITSQSSTALATAYGIQYGLIFVGYFFIIVAEGIVIKATSDIIEGKNLSLIQNLKLVLRRSWKLYIAYFVYGLIVGLGTLLLIIPGIYLAIIFALVLPAIVISDTGPMESFSFSKMLTGNDKMRTFGVLLASGLIASIATIPFMSIALYVLSPLNYLGVSTIFGMPMTNQFLAFNLPLLFAVTIILGMLGSTTLIVSPIILTTWFYALGGGLEKTREIKISKPGEETRFCSNCKRTISKESKFCPYCGEKQV
ncbi:MAG: hypothetical protein ACETWM_02805 [Candidatus Lokiarchaeia archaeon]